LAKLSRFLELLELIVSTLLRRFNGGNGVSFSYAWFCAGSAGCADLLGVRPMEVAIGDLEIDAPSLLKEEGAPPPADFFRKLPESQRMNPQRDLPFVKDSS
jgi:hypothetical protein